MVQLKRKQKKLKLKLKYCDDDDQVNRIGNNNKTYVLRKNIRFSN